MQGVENPHDYNVIKLAELLLDQPRSREQRLAKVLGASWLGLRAKDAWSFQHLHR